MGSVLSIDYKMFQYQIGALQSKLRESKSSSHDHHDMLKSELARRDETIQKLRHDVLRLQEKRDAYQAEVSYTDLPFYDYTSVSIELDFYVKIICEIIYNYIPGVHRRLSYWQYVPCLYTLYLLRGGPFDFWGGGGGGWGKCTWTFYLFFPSWETNFLFYQQWKTIFFFSV